MKHGDRNRAVGLARIVFYDNGRIEPRKAFERRPEAVFGGEIPACRRAARLPQGRAEARIDEESDGSAATQASKNSGRAAIVESAKRPPKECPMRTCVTARPSSRLFTSGFTVFSRHSTSSAARPPAGGPPVSSPLRPRRHSCQAGSQPAERGWHQPTDGCRRSRRWR